MKNYLENKDSKRQIRQVIFIFLLLMMFHIGGPALYESLKLNILMFFYLISMLAGILISSKRELILFISLFLAIVIFWVGLNEPYYATYYSHIFIFFITFSALQSK